MDRFRTLADLSIRRALGYAGLAMVCLMAGLAFDPLMAVRAGAVFAALTAAVLLAQAHRAPRRPYRRTELWLLLDGRHGLPEERAQEVLGQMLRERYLRHAELAAGVAVLLWLLALALTLVLPDAGAGAGTMSGQ